MFHSTKSLFEIQKKKSKKDPLLMKKSKNDPNAPPVFRIPLPELWVYFCVLFNTYAGYQLCFILS